MSSISEFFAPTDNEDNQIKLLERYAEIQHKIQPKLTVVPKNSNTIKNIKKIGQIATPKFKCCKLKILYLLLQNEELSLQIIVQGKTTVYADSRFNFIKNSKRSCEKHSGSLIIKFDFLPKEEQLLDIICIQTGNNEIKFIDFEIIF